MENKMLRESKTRGVLIPLIMVVVSLLVALVLAEAVIRLAYKDRIVLFPRYHTAAQYADFTLRRLRPSTVFWHTSIDGSWRFATNAQGYRDERDYHYDKPAGRTRILVLGDSHTQGFEVRQDRMYSAVIERFLRNEGMDIEVLNMGISGYSTAESLALLESEGIRYQPDVVVLGLFANDFEDNLKAGLFKLTEEGLDVAKRKHIPGVAILDIINAVPPLPWLSENSYLYSLTFNAVWDRAKRALLRDAERAAATEYAVATENITDAKKKLMLALLERMHNFCNKHDIKLVIMDIPSVIPERVFKSSIPPDIRSGISRFSHALIDSEEILDQYRYVTDIHVPNGHRHISEFSHALLGVATGKKILTWDYKKSTPRSKRAVIMR